MNDLDPWDSWVWSGLAAGAVMFALAVLLRACSA